MQRGLRQCHPFSPYLFRIAIEGLCALLLEADKKNILKRVVVDEITLVSHLQFAKDATLISEASTSYVQAIKFVLRWFEIIFSLKINFNKSILYSVNMDEEWLNIATLALNCKVVKLPFIDLGLPIGGNLHHHSFQKPMTEKFQSKLES